MSGAALPRSRPGSDLLIGFVSGVLAVAVFHQLAVFVFGFVGLGEGAVYSFRPTPPFGVPRVMSQMFWGGLWGVLFALVIDRLPARWPAALTGFVFALAGPVLFSWTVVASWRGAPLFGGFNPARMLSTVLVNGMFGIGVALIFAWLRDKAGGREPAG